MMKRPHKQEKKDLFQQLEQRYGSAFTQGMRDKISSCESQEIQYLEMKQMAEILFRFRERVRGVVNLYRNWKHDFESETDPVERVYKAYDGMFIRRQVSDAWRLYVTVNKDYHDMYRSYMNQLKNKRPYSLSYTDRQNRNAA